MNTSEESEDPEPKDLLHAAHPVSSVKVFHMKEVQQYLGHIFSLIDDLLTSRDQQLSYISQCGNMTSQK